MSNKLLIEYIYYEFEKLKLEQTKNKTTPPPPIINSAEPGVRNGDLYKFIKHINYIHDRIYIYIEKTNKVSQSFYTSTNITLIHFFFLLLKKSLLVIRDHLVDFSKKLSLLTGLKMTL